VWASILADPGAVSPWLLCVATLVSAVVGSLLPVSPTEPLLLALAAVAPPQLALPIAALATAGQMAGKVALYLGSRRADRALSQRNREKVQRASAGMNRSPALQSLTLMLSGATGVPPFYGVTVLSGVLHVPIGRFLLFGTIGRGARFAAIVLVPRLLAGG
jgi:membrane protein YqaA with SNARE-associated domain